MPARRAGSSASRSAIESPSMRDATIWPSHQPFWRRLVSRVRTAVSLNLARSLARGPVLRKVVVARFTRTMGTLLSSGVPILDAMDIVARTAGNKVVEAGILYARSRISEGKDLATPLMETGLMPPMVVQMIAVGEQTGALDAMLQKIADFYEDEVDSSIANLTSIIEPLMMILVGLMVGVIIIAMYMPMFKMLTLLQ